MGIIKVLKNKFSREEKKDKKLTPVILDDKVDEFIKWYADNIVKGKYSEIGEYSEPKEMRDFIEKVAVWYELRYPDYEVNRILHCCSQENKHINDNMFRNNPYVNSVFTKYSDINYYNWTYFYNTKAFINSLPSSEKWYFKRPKYESIVYFQEGISSCTHLHLTSKGKVEMEGENICFRLKNGNVVHLNDSSIGGLHIKKVVYVLEKNGVEFSENSNVKLAIRNYDNRVYQKDEMLNCIMYRIIERGGNRIGPRRAFLFAKEFGRNIDIPMKYGVDTSDPGLREFINEYLKAGGSKELVCYESYFCRAKKYEQVNNISIEELFIRCSKCANKNYTSEEKELHQKLVNVLVSQLDYQMIKKEENKNSRLQRKIAKVSKNNA